LPRRHRRAGLFDAAGKPLLLLLGAIERLMDMAKVALVFQPSFTSTDTRLGARWHPRRIIDDMLELRQD
jgi:hypothetical protein